MIFLRLGIHTSIAGSLEGAAIRAADLGANAFQIFSTNPRMWRAQMPDAADVRRLKLARESLDLTPLAVHGNYLINLAAADSELLAKSMSAFRGELERTLLIGADYLVAHPGNYKGRSIEEGIASVVRSLAKAARGFSTTQMMLLLENTAGSGSAIGSRFEELAEIREKASGRVEFQIGYCLDTAHCLAAGYDIASTDGLSNTIREADQVLGLDNVKVIHANDSKGPLGSHVDRHEHIGKGYIGARAFRRLLNHPKLRGKTYILETPIDREGDDRKNVETLKRLCRRRPTTTTESN